MLGSPPPDGVDVAEGDLPMKFHIRDLSDLWVDVLGVAANAAAVVVDVDTVLVLVVGVPDEGVEGNPERDAGGACFWLGLSDDVRDSGAEPIAPPTVTSSSLLIVGGVDDADVVSILAGDDLMR